MGWFLILLSAAIFFVIDWFVAKRFDEIAQMKGQPPKKYIWWCFWLWVIGWAMVIALPDRGNAQEQNHSDTDELPEL